MAGTSAVLTPERVLRRLEWHVIRRLDGRLQGNYRTLLAGAGIDFKDLRDYEPGDDVRHIDWNVTARMDTPYVRQYVEDRELTAWLLLDRSPSMTFGPVDRPKDLVLTEFATTFAGLLARGGNRVGAILFNNAVDSTIEPSGGRRHVLRLAYELLRPVQPTGTSTDLSTLIQAALTTVKRRSLVVLISDFISEPGWEAPLALLSQRHEVVAVQLIDQREYELPDVGIVVVEDAETGEQLHVNTSDVSFRARLREAAFARQAEIERVAVRAGVDLHRVSTEEDLVGAFVRIVERRKRRRR
jgi:uncharacterized protein (DUF58 family)